MNSEVLQRRILKSNASRKIRQAKEVVRQVYDPSIIGTLVVSAAYNLEWAGRAAAGTVLAIFTPANVELPPVVENESVTMRMAKLNEDVNVIRAFYNADSVGQAQEAAEVAVALAYTRPL